MSPKKMIGLSLRQQAQTLRGSLTVWPPLNMSDVFFARRHEKAARQVSAGLLHPLGRRAAPILPPAAQTIYAAALALGR